MSVTHPTYDNRTAIEPTNLVQVNPFGQPAIGHSGKVDALAMIAHDLRGPLASLGSLLELIGAYAERDNSESVSRCTERASTVVSRLADLLNSTLDRVRDGGDPLSFRPSLVDLGHVLAEAVALHAPSAWVSSIDILLRCGEALPIAGDEQLLLQAVENLVTNAIKYALPGEPVICSAERIGGRALITVANKCSAADRAELDRAFRPFLKLSDKSRADSRSFGLGLWMVKLIAERHGGKTSVVPLGDDGFTKFTIELPLRDQ